MIFGQHDLGQRAPFPAIDLVLCRNVLIYFTAELQRRALQLFAFALRNGGYLALGKAESPQHLASYFTPVQAAIKLYQRTGERLIVPPMRLSQDGSPPPPSIAPGGRLSVRVAVTPPRLPTTNERLGALVLGLAAGVVVVDRRYDIQAINDEAQRLLGITRAALGEDLVHLVAHPAGGVLRSAIDTALHTEVAEAELAIPTAVGVQRHLHLTAYPHQQAAPNALVTGVLLLLTEIVAPREPPQAWCPRAALARQRSKRKRGNKNANRCKLSWRR